MILIIRDTREQSPLSFSTYKEIDRSEDIAIPFGDYTAMIGSDEEGFKQVPVVFERKSISDLWGTMTSGYERFRKEIKKAEEAKFKLILITECSYSEVAHGFDRSEYTGESMIKKLSMLYVKYDLEWWPCSGREEMAHRIVATFSAIDRFWSKTSSIDTGFKEDKESAVNLS